MALTTSATAPVRRRQPLTVGAVESPAEREADAVARTVVAVLRSAPIAATTSERIRRSTADVGASPGLSPIGADGGELNADTSDRIDGERGRGMPMPTRIRRRFEGALGADLGAVRVHTGQPFRRTQRRPRCDRVHVGFRRVLQWWPPRPVRTIGPASPRSRADPRRPAAWRRESSTSCGRVRVRSGELDARTHRPLLVVAGDRWVHRDSQRRRESVRGDDRQGRPARVDRRPIGRRLDAYRVGDDKARPGDRRRARRVGDDDGSPRGAQQQPHRAARQGQDQALERGQQRHDLLPLPRPGGRAPQARARPAVGGTARRATDDRGHRTRPSVPTDGEPVSHQAAPKSRRSSTGNAWTAAPC